MTPDRILVLRRTPLALACRTLPGEALRVLIALAHGACPSTGRIWTTPLRLADDWDMPLGFVTSTLELLVAGGHIARVGRSQGALAAYEFGALLYRHAAPPTNLPVSPDP